MEFEYIQELLQGGQLISVADLWQFNESIQNLFLGNTRQPKLYAHVQSPSDMQMWLTQVNQLTDVLILRAFINYLLTMILFD